MNSPIEIPEITQNKRILIRKPFGIRNEVILKSFFCMVLYYIMIGVSLKDVKKIFRSVAERTNMRTNLTHT